MKKFLLLVFVFVFALGLIATSVSAQEDGPLTDEEPTRSEASQDVGWLPDPESRFFGLQIAWMNLVENFERIGANTDDKKLELELKYAEKQAKLDQMIESAMERNPDLVPKLEERKIQLEESYQARLARIDERLERFQERRDNFEDKKDNWVDRVQDRRERLQERRDHYLRQDTENRDRPSIQDEEVDDEGIDSRDAPVRDLPEANN